MDNPLIASTTSLKIIVGNTLSYLSDQFNTPIVAQLLAVIANFLRVQMATSNKDDYIQMSVTEIVALGVVPQLWSR